MVPTAALPRTRIAGLAARARNIVDSGLCAQTAAVPDWLARLDQLEHLALSVAAARLDGMNGDEQLLRGRVYGFDYDDPDPSPRPWQTYAALIGGPLDGLLLDITGWRPEEVDDGAALLTELSRWPGGSALYDPRPGEARTPGPRVMCRFYYSGDTP